MGVFVIQWTSPMSYSTWPWNQISQFYPIWGFSWIFIMIKVSIRVESSCTLTSCRSMIVLVRVELHRLALVMVETEHQSLHRLTTGSWLHVFFHLFIRYSGNGFISLELVNNSKIKYLSICLYWIEGENNKKVSPLTIIKKGVDRESNNATSDKQQYEQGQAAVLMATMRRVSVVTIRPC